MFASSLTFTFYWYRALPLSLYTDDEIVACVNDYVEAAPDEAEIFLRNLYDYVTVRFPFLDLTDQHKQVCPPSPLTSPISASFQMCALAGV
jgi:hypothetical protein